MRSRRLSAGANSSGAASGHVRTDRLVFEVPTEGGELRNVASARIITPPDQHRQLRAGLVGFASFAVVMFASTLRVSTAHAYCRLTTETQLIYACNTAGTPLAWHRHCLEVGLDDATVQVLPLARVRAVLADAYATWTEVSCAGSPVGLDVRVLATPATCAMAQHEQHGPNANVVAFVSDWEARSYSDQALALTFVWHDSHSGEIFDADTMINLEHGPFLLCDMQSCSARSVDLGAVFTHEAGHLFGLAHSQDADALMNATYDHTTAARRTLAADDEAGLCAIYGQRASTSCNDADFTPAGGLSLACVDAGVSDASVPSRTKPRGGCAVTSPCATVGGGSGFWIRGSGLMLALLLVRRRAARGRGSRKTVAGGGIGSRMPATNASR